MVLRGLSIGDTYALPLVVKNSEVKITRGNKPYLLLELTDGTDSIFANIWDWDKAAIEKNTIVNLEGAVTEYQGNKQLSVSAISRNKELDVSYFAPKGDFDVQDYLDLAHKLIDSVDNVKLHNIAKQLFADNEDLWRLIPGAKSIHHAFVAGMLKHSVDVTIKAEALASCIGPEYCSRDLCVIGALLHDFGKLWTYKLTGVVIDMTEEGQMLDHIAIGIKEIEKYKTDDNMHVIGLVQHIMSSHHGKLEYGSPTTPRFLEAWIVSCADLMNARAEVIKELNKKAGPDDIMTGKDWSLENRPMFTQKYIHSILEK